MEATPTYLMMTTGSESRKLYPWAIVDAFEVTLLPMVAVKGTSVPLSYVISNWEHSTPVTYYQRSSGRKVYI